jgi:hypothetical protein
MLLEQFTRIATANTDHQKKLAISSSLYLIIRPAIGPNCQQMSGMSIPKTDTISATVDMKGCDLSQLEEIGRF